MSKPKEVKKVFKEKDISARRKSDKEMEKQGYYVFKEESFRDHKLKNLIKGGIIGIGFKVMSSNDRFVKVTYKKK